MLEWNHNTYYHKLLLHMNKLPETLDSVLDIGSGRGLFSYKLSFIFKEVFSLEPDMASIEFCKIQYKSRENITFIHDSFMEHDFGDQKFDSIYAIASIHHMDFETASLKMKALLKPGGKLILLGLYRDYSVSDYLMSMIAVFPNFIMNLLSMKKALDSSEMTTTPPQMTLGEIKRASHSIFIDYHFRRHLFWRYTLIFVKT